MSGRWTLVWVFAFFFVLAETATTRTAQDSRDRQMRHDRYVNLLRTYFSKSRHPFDDEANWLEARKGVNAQLESIVADVRGTSLDIQYFDTEITVESNIPAPVRGANIIATFSGQNRGTSADQVLVIGAHYDSESMTSGINDNGSGVVALLEVARALGQALKSGQIRLENTVMFVAFDVQKLEHENTGSLDKPSGSWFFVNEKLDAILNVPNAPSFLGAIILDSVLNFNGTQRSQVLPNGFDLSFPDAFETIRSNNYTGNYMAMVTKEKLRSLQLDAFFSQQWRSVCAEQAAKSPLMSLEIRRASPSPAIFEFLRQDHVAFWNYVHNETSRPLPAILLTDTGKWRGMPSDCGSGPCDVAQLVNQDRLDLLDHVVQSLGRFVLEAQATVLPTTSPPGGHSAPLTSTWTCTLWLLLLAYIVC